MFEQEYTEVTSALGLKADVFFYRDLVSRYKEPQRVYHNAGHVKRMLGYIDRLAELEGLSDSEVNVVKLATFYHDSVYVPGWKKNEFLSAAMAINHLDEMSGGFGMGELKGEMEYLIATTMDHESGTPMSNVLCAADLYELGTKRYNLNGLHVWMEFGSPAAPVWQTGRIKFLETYLAKDQLFYVPGMIAHEAKARANMEQELAKLQGALASS